MVSYQKKKWKSYTIIHVDGRRVTVPRHDPIKVGVLKAIIGQAKTTEEEFLKH